MTLYLLFGLLLTGVSAALVVRAVTLPKSRIAARVAAIDDYGLVDAARTGAAPARSERLVTRCATAIGVAIASRAGDRLDLEALRKLLLTAGYHRARAETFLGYQFIAAVGCAVLPVLAGSLTPLRALMVVPLALCGWVLPRFVVQRKATRRAEDIEDALPDLIDLLVVTVEAGLSISSSMATASRRTDGPLGEELRLAMQEQRMGLPVADVLQNMLHRADNPSMRSFVRSLVQGESLGVSIGTIMRNLSVEMRKRRRARAEERANKAPVKMLFPLIFLIFPALFIVMLGPAMINIMDTLGSV